jgi:adenine-specific DNA-methyltransferase
MARINDLLKQLDEVDSELAKEIKAEVKALSDRREFGLNFERHTPEQVELPGRPVRRGDKVHILPPRGETVKAQNKVMWLVTAIDKSSVPSVASLSRLRGQDETKDVPVEDLVVVAEFRDPIYPGLVSTGKVERGGDKPFHAVINSENFHALEALMFTHRGKVDCIYIDPPYNTGSRDWKYNNDYVEAEDNYRHSKWLAFMERRLRLARELLKQDDSVLVVAIDENEHATLSLLLTQIFPERSMTSISVVHNPRGVQGNNFSYTHEYLIFAVPSKEKLIAGRILNDAELKANTSNLRNWGGESLRSDAKNCFYPIFISNGKVTSFGTVPDDDHHPDANELQDDGSIAVWPIDENGVERKWRYARQSVEAIKSSLVVKAARNGEVAVHLAQKEGKYRTVWQDTRHDASTYGSQLVTAFTKRKFPFPKSLYAVYDALHAATGNKKDALIVDFFSGSGTTAHATMLLNKEDGGRRQVISITNNEVSDEEQKELRKKELRPGDAGWEEFGICDFITKPRIEAAIRGATPNGEPLEGVYRCESAFRYEDGFNENAEFFTLTYEDALSVSANRCFSRIASLLWLKAGAVGTRIDNIGERGWETAETYGVLVKLDGANEFLTAVAGSESIRTVFVFTDEDRLFESVVRELAAHIEPVRMYDAYMQNAELDAMAVTR